MSLHVPGKITTPNLMNPPLFGELCALASFASNPGAIVLFFTRPDKRSHLGEGPRLSGVLDLADVVLDHRVREELPAHLVEPRPGPGRIGLVEAQLEDLADPQLPHLREAQALERLSDRRALR